MLILHPAPDCDRCQSLAQRLKDESLAHRVEPIDAGSRTIPPHSIEDGDEMFEGHDDVEKYIDANADWLARSRRYQSDVCYDYGDDDDAPRCGTG